MARKKGSANLAASLEVLAGAPLDARTVVDNKTDLITAATFSYYYVGMPVFVIAESKMYVLAGDDPTVDTNWKELGEGSGGGGGTSALYTGTLLASGWSNKTQTVTVPGISANDNGTIGLLNTATSAQIEAAREAVITVSTVASNSVTFACEEVPLINIPFGIVVGGGGGGDAVLENNLTTGITVGGIDAGTTYEDGTPLETILNDLLNPTLYPAFTNPSATLSGTGDKLLETGATLAVTLTTTFNRGTINPAYGTSGYRSGEAVDYSLNSGTAQAGNTFTETISDANKTFKVKVNYAAGEQPKDSKGGDYSSALEAGYVETSTLTYSFVDAMWANTASIGTIAKLSLIAKSTKQRDMVFPAQTVANPEVFDIPASWTVTAVQVKNDLSGQYEDASSQFTVTDTTHNDAAGNSVAYKRYTFNMGMATGSRTVRVKWS